MSGVATLRVSTAMAPAAAGTQVIPVLSGMPTLSGFNPSTGPSASLMTLDALATFFGGGGAGPFLPDDGTTLAPAYSFADHPTSGMFYDTADDGVVLQGPASQGVCVTDLFQVGDDGDWGTAFSVNSGATAVTIGSTGYTVGITGTVALVGPVTLGNPAAASAIVFDGTGYGAGVASVRFNGLTTAATNNLVGTLTNSPVTGNPTFWMPVSIAGTIKYIPCF